MKEYKSRLGEFTDMVMKEYVSFHEFVGDREKSNDRIEAFRLKREIPGRVNMLRKTITENSQGFNVDIEYLPNASGKAHRKDVWIGRIIVPGYIPGKIEMDMNCHENGINEAIRNNLEWGNMGFDCRYGPIHVNDERTSIMVPSWLYEFIEDMNITLKDDEKMVTECYTKEGRLGKIHFLKHAAESRYGVDVPLDIMGRGYDSMLMEFLVPLNMNKYRSGGTK
jgi:hypothetical protein